MNGNGKTMRAGLLAGAFLGLLLGAGGVQGQVYEYDDGVTGRQPVTVEESVDVLGARSLQMKFLDGRKKGLKSYQFARMLVAGKVKGIEAIDDRITRIGLKGAIRYNRVLDLNTLSRIEDKVFLFSDGGYSVEVEVDGERGFDSKSGLELECQLKVALFNDIHERVGKMRVKWGVESTKGSGYKHRLAVEGKDVLEMRGKNHTMSPDLDLAVWRQDEMRDAAGDWWNISVLMGTAAGNRIGFGLMVQRKMAGQTLSRTVMARPQEVEELLECRAKRQAELERFSGEMKQRIKRDIRSNIRGVSLSHTTIFDLVQNRPATP